MNRGKDPASGLGGLDSALLRKIGESPDGRRLRAALGDEDALAEAVRRGDGEALRGALGRLLATPEGQRLFRELGSMTGKGRG